MSQARRLTALTAVACIGVAGVLAAAQWVRDLGDSQARFLTNPVVVTAQGALRPVEGRFLEWWGKTQRRADCSVGKVAARALALRGNAQERAPRGARPHPRPGEQTPSR